MYSFWWDVTNDWGFDLLQFTPKSRRPRQPSLPRALVLPAMQERDQSITSPRNSTTSTSPSPSSPPVLPHAHSHPVRVHPYGLRPRLLYPLPVYPLALFINLVLRLTWSIKLSTHLHAKAQGEGSFFIFWIEVAELVRRWVWVFIRVEWEIVKRDQEGAKYTDHSDVEADPESIELLSTRTTSVDEPALRDRHC